MRHSRTGNTALQVALSMVGVLGFAAIGIDLTVLKVYDRELANVAEASAHAGAAQLDGTAEGMAAARTSAVSLAGQNTVLGTPMELDANTANDADGDVVLGRLNEDDAFEPTTDPALATAVKATAYRGGFGTYFAGLFGLSEVSSKQYSIAVAGGPRGAECPLPIAVPTCSLPPEGVCGLDVVMSDANNDNAAWALPGDANPDANSARDAIDGCTASSSTTDTLSLNNGQITSVLNTLADAVAASDEYWDSTEFGEAIPTQITQSAIPTAQYGKVLRRLGMVYTDPSNCTNSQFNYDGVPIVGYVTMVVYDVRSAGSDKVVKMRIACDEAPETSGGGYFGTTAPPRLVVE
jgi:hypothetical protein